MKTLKLIAFIALIASCKTKPQIIIQRTDSVTITERIERDTISIPLHDSAFYELYLKCVDGRVEIDRELKQLGRMLRLSYELEGNTLRINSIIEDSLMHVVERLTREIERTRSEVITPVFDPEPPKETGLKWWQKPLSFAFWVLVIMILIYIAEKLYKNTK